MVQNNKVLTVSYGTFSCTLEGFDDSFETMKAIAEYFRDLAAEDRYFGSEPPQPDAEMLTRIAQRDVTQKVEASQNDTGLLLRATDTTDATATAAPTPAAPAPAPTPEPAQPPVNAAPSAPADEPTADSIAAKLQRIRAVVSHSDEAPATYSEDEDTSYLQPAKPKVDAISAAFAAGALSPADLEEPVDDVEDIAPAAMPQMDQFEEDQTEDLPETVIPSEEVETPVEEMIHEPVEELIEEPAEELNEEPVEELVETATETEEEEIDEAEVALAEDIQETLQDEEPVDLQDDEPVEEQEEADATALIPAEEVEETPHQDEVTESDVLFSDLDDASEPEAEDQSNILGDAEAEEEKDEADTLADIARDVISAEDEALLLDEIALVEAELDSEAPVERADLSGLDQDVSRLMDKADEQLDDPSTNDQRETYSHLRTAVAATEAELAEGKGAKGEREDDYRGDLASVVSPRRPEVEVTSERPASDIAAPLKLVAEQRVDIDDAESGPVMPRRVTSSEDAADEEGGFATFAQEQGAQSLPDLLEAAAAYLSFIEGQEQFSRPQLMNKVRSLKQEAFNREESLRSFGQLLRDGKIEKAGGGRFAASTQIGFRPDDDERAAG